eukprot:TRINITY_DN9836_c0_g1_i1.p1 TRINITY_DN9836_c0_g1~~TRINITY_DN9836_c0_g1_i1.p1  ORF type:complete len:116 (-),score=29.28 TRINITY_DN9836_c0_g1_i1:87-386(-)
MEDEDAQYERVLERLDSKPYSAVSDAFTVNSADVRFAIKLQLMESGVDFHVSRNGINKIDSLHQEFDPNYHEALFKMPTSEHPPDCVVQVISRGIHSQR